MPGSLAIPGLAAGLRRLYSGAGAAEEEDVTRNVVAHVLDAPSLGVGAADGGAAPTAASAADADAAAAFETAATVSDAAIRSLCLHSGAHIVLNNTAAGRSCRARVFAADDDHSSSSNSSGAPPRPPTAQPELGLPPLIAYNLGLLYQLQPFLGATAAADAATAAAPPLPLPLQLAPDDAVCSGRAYHHAPLPAAAAVTICKVPQPTLDPLVLVEDHMDGSSSSSSGISKDNAAAAAGAAGGGDGGGVADGFSEGGAVGAPSPQEQQQEQRKQQHQQQQAEQHRAIQSALQRHFTSAQRCVSVGDLIGVLLPPAAAAGQLPRVAGGSKADSTTLPTAVYFRVTEVQPPPAMAGGSGSCSSGWGPLRVDTQTTAMMLEGGSSRAPLPVGFIGFAAALQQQQEALRGGSSSGGCEGNHSKAAAQRPLLGVHATAAWHPAPGLPGVCGPLLPSWRGVARTVAPLLHPAAVDVPVRAALLLHGPRGSGKQTAARAAAAALGMHCISWSCLEIRVSGGGGVRQGGTPWGVAAA